MIAEISAPLPSLRHEVTMSAAVQTPAAQYLRMSTQHQQYSLDNQRSAIKRYADQHGFTVVRTYKDAAKRGVY